MVILVCVFKFYGCGVWLDLSDVEEHFVDFLVRVDVWATKIVGLSNRFLHFKAVHDCECNVSNVYGLYFSIHSFDLPVHTVKHLHLHAPLGSKSWVLMQKINDIRWTNNSHIRVNGLYLLFADPLSSKTTRL